MDVAVLQKEALQLPDKDRALLADSLLASLSVTPSELEAAWVREADERLQAFRVGQIGAFDGPAAMADLIEISEMSYRLLSPALGELSEAAAFYEEEVLIVSVFHQSREPRSWRENL